MIIILLVQYGGYLISLYGSNTDSNFSLIHHKNFHNSILVGKISNLFYRFNKFIPYIENNIDINYFLYKKNIFVQYYYKSFNILFFNIDNYLENCDIKNFFLELLKLIDKINNIINILEPWNNKNNKNNIYYERIFIFCLLIGTLRYIYLIHPKKIQNFFNQYNIVCTQFFKQKKWNIDIIFNKIFFNKYINLKLNLKNKFIFIKLFKKIYSNILIN